ncbi:MAG: hypothetical protein ACTTHM_02175 [Peptoanaerobacter stomatis]|uniref:hypothetical protein n=1 Tax=Peptoanaerobacter stomatis TaxID=796937 RepID=UPI003FA0E20B
MDNWKDKAYELYFVEHRKINDIAKLIGKSRQSVSAFLNTKNIDAEKERRKDISKIKQKKRNKANMRKVRTEGKSSLIEYALLKRQHIIDVNVLSRERHFCDI